MKYDLECAADSIRKTVREYVWNSVRHSAWSPVKNSVEVYVNIPVSDSVWESMFDFIKESTYEI